MAAKKNKTTSSEPAEKGPRSTPLVVAVSASGAQSRSLERFLAKLMVDEQMAVVLVFQQREALNEERLKAVLSEHGRALTLAVHGTPVEPGRIYWSAPNTILTIEDGRFHIRPAQQPPGERATARILPDFPFTATDREPAEGPSLPRPRRIEGGLARQAEIIAERHAPAYVVTDENFDVMHSSGRTGRYIEPAGGAATLNLLNLVHDDLRLDLRAALNKAAEEHQAIQIDGLRVDTNGKRLIVDIVVEPVRDEPNEAPGFVVVFKDRPAPPEEEADTAAGGSFLRDEHVQRLETDLRVTRERLQATNEELQSVNEKLTTVNGELAHRAQQALRESEEHTKLLLAELQHRVRNTLAVVRSITRRTAANSETADDYAMHLEGRIEALARMQTMATRSADAGVNLEEMVRDELLAHAVRDDEKAQVDGPVIRLQTTTAEKLGMAVHELATNAVKYGALSENGGHIEVTWRIEGVDGDRRLTLTWRETGVRIAGAAPRRRGFGTELIERTLPHEIDAKTELEFTPGGVRCVIDFPLSERTAILSAHAPTDQSVEDGRTGGLHPSSRR